MNCTLVSRLTDRPTGGAGQGACPWAARRSLGSGSAPGIPQPLAPLPDRGPAQSAPASGQRPCDPGLQRPDLAHPRRPPPTDPIRPRPPVRLRRRPRVFHRRAAAAAVGNWNHRSAPPPGDWVAARSPGASGFHQRGSLRGCAVSCLPRRSGARDTRAALSGRALGRCGSTQRLSIRR